MEIPTSYFINLGDDPFFIQGDGTELGPLNTNKGSLWDHFLQATGVSDMTAIR